MFTVISGLGGGQFGLKFSRLKENLRTLGNCKFICA